MGSVTKFIQNNLNTGEISPRLTARDDYDRYQSAVQTMRNFVPLPHGGARTRSGLSWVAQTKDGAKAYLIPFEFGTTAAYIIEAGDQYFRFYKDNARLSDLTGIVTNIQNNGVGLIRVTSAAHGLSTNDYVYLTGVTGTTEANGEWKVTVIDVNTFDLQGSAFTNPYVSGGTWSRPYQITTPYLLADIPFLQWAQSADTLYLTHQAYAVRKLTRTGDTAWTLTPIDFVDGPYMDINRTATTLKSSANTGNGVTITASSPIFTANHVGSLWRIKGNSVWGYVKMTAFVSSTVMTADVILPLDFPTPGTSTTTQWREGAWSVHRGFPTTVTIYEQRLIFAATPTEPQTIWGSTIGSYEDFTPSATSGTVAASDAFTYRLGSNKVNVIRWLAGVRHLLIGTVGEEFSLTGGSAAISAVNPPLVVAGTQYGSAAIPAIRVGGLTYFVQRSGRKVRSLYFDFNTDAYKSPDVSLRAEHLFRAPSGSPIVQAAYQQEPDSVIWFVRQDGTFVSFTVYDIEEVFGWAQHSTDGTVVALASIPAPDLRVDDLWMVVARTVGGTTKHFVEFTDPAIAVDSALSYDGTVTTATLTPGATSGTGVTFTASASVFGATDVGKELILRGHEVNGVKWYSRATITTVVSGTQVTADITAPFPNTQPVPGGVWGLGITTVRGLDHLNGRTVQIVGDQAVYEPQTVVDGAVTLQYGGKVGPAAVVITAGLAFNQTPLIRTLQPAYRDQDGVIRNKFKHWAFVEVAVEDTVGLRINGRVEIPYRKPSDPMDVGPPPFTGDKIVPVLHTTRDGVLTFEQQLPLPATILAYAGELEVGD